MATRAANPDVDCPWARSLDDWRKSPFLICGLGVFHCFCPIPSDRVCAIIRTTGRQAMNNHRFSRRYFFYGTLLAGAVPSGGFGSTPSLPAAGLQVAEREAQYRRGRSRHPRSGDSRRRRRDREHRRAVRRGRGALRPRLRAVPEGQKVQRLPQDVRDRGQEHRRGDDRHARSHAHADRAARHAARQARLLREAA